MEFRLNLTPRPFEFMYTGDDGDDGGMFTPGGGGEILTPRSFGIVCCGKITSTLFTTHFPVHNLQKCSKALPFTYNKNKNNNNKNNFFF